MKGEKLKALYNKQFHWLCLRIVPTKENFIFWCMEFCKCFLRDDDKTLFGKFVICSFKLTLQIGY